MNWEQRLHGAVSRNDIDLVRVLLKTEDVREGIGKDVWHPGT